MTGAEIAAEAFAHFDAWCREHDPEDDLTIEQKVKAYGEWCDANPLVTVNAISVHRQSD